MWVVDGRSRDAFTLLVVGVDIKVAMTPSSCCGAVRKCAGAGGVALDCVWPWVDWLVRLGVLSFSSIEVVLGGGVDGIIATSACASDGGSYAIVNEWVIDCFCGGAEVIAKWCREVAVCTSAVRWAPVI